MTTPTYEYADVVKAWTVLLRPFVGGDETHIGTQTPADLELRLPFIRVVRSPGGPTTRVDETARLEVDVFAATYTEAEPLARRIRDWLIFNGPHRADGVVVDRIGCDAGPQELPWSDRVRRFGTSYTVETRPIRITG